MINGKKVLAIIPARGGSKGVPRKNIRELAGKPLIAWTIDEAKKSKYIDRIILSSEDEEIISIAQKWQCDVPFRRPVELAQDDTPGIEPVIHAVNGLPECYEIVVILQPTSPMRIVEDIDGCLECYEDSHANSCVSVTESAKHPMWMFKLNCEQKLESVLKVDEIPYRRQELEKVYALNGAVYVIQRDYLLTEKKIINNETVAYIMPHERGMDIDNEMDFKICDLIKKELKVNANL